MLELNESSDSIIRKKLILDGSQMHNARFGYSLATPGDLNLDGFNDVVIGAPSNNNGNGQSFRSYLHFSIFSQ